MERYTQLLFKQKHPSWMLFVVAGILTAAFGILVLGDGKLATQLAQPQPSQELATQQFQPEEPVIEYVSNELLIKIRSPQHKKIKQNPESGNTGLSSLNKLNKEQGVTKFERIAKPSKKTKNPSHEVFRWYKITLPGEREIIKEEGREGASMPEELVGESRTSEKGQKIKSVLAKYKGDTNIETAELNHIVRTTSIPNDTYADPEQDGTWSQGSWGQPYEDLWGLKKIEADKAWDITTGSEDVVVAVVDTGVDYTHSDIQANIWTNSDEIPANNIDDDGNGFVDDVRGWDFYNSDNDPMDDYGHGTHVAGTIGAVGNNGIGVVGVNWQVKIMPVKFLGANGRGETIPAGNALIYAVDNGARILNNSWAGAGGSNYINDVLYYAHERGVVVVAGAGNDNEDALGFYPANSPHAITVAASDPSDLKASFSNWGIKIDVAAPGVDILSTRAVNNPMCTAARTVGTNYCRVSGTSMATPHVAGLAALLLSAHPDFSNEEVRHAIRNTTDKISGKDWDINFGYGRINNETAVLVHNAPPVARINRIENGKVFGTADSRFEASYTLSYGSGTDPLSLTTITQGTAPVRQGELGVLDMLTFSSGIFTLQLEVTDNSGTISRDRFLFDPRPPEVSITWPHNFDLVSEAFYINIEVSDEYRIRDVEAYYGDTFIGNTGPFPSNNQVVQKFIRWGTFGSVPDGPYQITVRAHDVGGNTAETHVKVNVSNPTPPSSGVFIAKPSPESLVFGTIWVQIAAGDPDGVFGIESYLDYETPQSKYLGSKSGGNILTFSWDTTVVADGTHAISAFALDNLGNQHTAVIEVEVGNNLDSDADGFTNRIESFMGTDPFRACGPNAWPPDFNDDGIVQIDDVTAVASRFGSKVGDANYSPRYELASQDGTIQIDDVAKISGLFGRSCLP